MRTRSVVKNNVEKINIKDHFTFYNPAKSVKFNVSITEQLLNLKI